MTTDVRAARPLHSTVAIRLIGSAANYWLALVGDIVIAGAFFVLGVRLFSGSIVEAVVAAVVGFVAWGGIEYGVHRWVFHGPPSLARRAHARHHADGMALISAPLFMSAALAVATFAILSVALPSGHAAFVVFGLYAGYNHYALLHHLLHRRRVAHGPFAVSGTTRTGASLPSRARRCELRCQHILVGPPARELPAVRRFRTIARSPDDPRVEAPPLRRDVVRHVAAQSRRSRSNSGRVYDADHTDDTDNPRVDHTAGRR